MDTSFKVFDIAPDRPSDAKAAYYVRKKLDVQITHLWVDTDANREEIRRLIGLRYGQSLVDDIRLDEPNPELAVAKALVERERQKEDDEDARMAEFDGIGTIVFAEWNEEGTVQYLRERLESRWPKKVEPFVAFDAGTLFAANQALDFAEQDPRAGEVFDHPSILILGPTGTGKEILARAIHSHAANLTKTKGEFGALNCGGLNDQLLESELFGHLRGAFTDASTKKIGFVKAFEDGTVFLDEVGDMPASVQVRVLRWLNSGEIRPVGSNKPDDATPRIICATHRELQPRRRGSQPFREDLYHRIAGRVLRLSPLAARRDTIPRVSNWILDYLHSERGRPAPTILPDAQRAMMLYKWPGNMRELRNVLDEIYESGHRCVGVHDLRDELVHAYFDGTDAEQQIRLDSEAGRIRGESDSTIALTTAATLRVLFLRHQEEPDSIQSRLTTAAEVIGAFANAIGLEEELDPYADELWYSANVAAAESFRADYLEPLGEIDDEAVHAALRSAESDVARFEDETERELRSIEVAPTASAVPALVSLMIPFLRALPTEVLDDLRGSFELLGTDRFGEFAQQLGTSLRGLSVTDVKRELGMEILEGDPLAQLRERLREDADALAEHLNSHPTINVAAKAAGVTRHTIGNWRRKLGVKKNDDGEWVVIHR